MNLLKAGLFGVTGLLALASVIPSNARAEGPKDPFFHAPVVPEGKYKGKPLEDFARSFEIIDKHRFIAHFGEAAYQSIPDRDNVHLIANFTYKREYAVAAIPKGAIESIRFHMQHFGPMQAHTELHMVMEEGRDIQLFFQNNVQRPSERTAEMIFTIDGVSHYELVDRLPPGTPADARFEKVVVGGVEKFKIPGPPWTIKSGLNGAMGVANRLMAVPDKAEHQMINNDYVVEQWRVAGGKVTLNQIFESLLITHHDPLMNRSGTYHLLKNNCTTALLAALRVAMNKKPYGWLGRFLSGLPIPFAKSLLMDMMLFNPDNYEMPTLNAELNERFKNELKALRAEPSMKQMYKDICRRLFFEGEFPRP
jgi:hypothetical protein